MYGKHVHVQGMACLYMCKKHGQLAKQVEVPSSYAPCTAVNTTTMLRGGEGMGWGPM